MNTSKRRFSAMFVIAAITGAWWTPGRSLAQPTKLSPTPQDAEGPYYPKTWDGDVDHDLVTMHGRSYARGTPLTITGTLRTVDGAAMVGARVEIWQTDEQANYRHPESDGEGPAERGFQGYGFATTDVEGRYRFRTIKPKQYGGRPPHVHFKVMAAQQQTLITEMYFVGENAEGSLWQRLFGGFSKERDRLSVTPTVRRQGTLESLEAVFDLVLAPAR